MSVDVRALMADDTFRRAYEDWLKSPVTTRMRELAVEASVPVALPNPVSEKDALYMHGQAVGWAGFMRLVFSLVDTIEMQQKMEAAQTRLRPSYGAERLVGQFIPPVTADKKE